MVNTDDLRKAAIAIYLATDEEVADDISNKLKNAANEIERLRTIIKLENLWD